MKTYPILRLSIPLAAGIFFAECFHEWLPQRGIAFLLLLVFVALSGGLFLRKYGYRWVFGAGAVSFMFLTGYLLTDLKGQQVRIDWSSEKGVYEGTVLEMPVEKERSIQYKLQVNGKNILLYLSKDSVSRKVRMGDCLQFYTQIRPPENRGDSIGFDYAAYLYHKGISGTAFAASGYWRVRKEEPSLSLKQKALSVRERIVGEYRKWGMSEEQLPVLSALTIGYKAELDKEQRDRYSAAGISHVLALSGLHVGIIWTLLGMMLRPLEYTRHLRWLKWGLSTALLWAFAFVSGLEASVVRAVIMCMLMELGRLSGSRTLSMNTLAIAACCMLLYNPFYLFDVGFQLSFVAVISILLFYSLFNRLVRTDNRLLRWGWSTMSVSLAAQLGTAPLVMYCFSNFSVYFLLANMVAAVLVPLIIGMGLLAWVLVPFPVLCRGLSAGLGILIDALNATAQEISAWPYAWLTGLDVPAVEAGMAYLVLLAMWYHWKQPRRRSLIFLLSCVALVLAVHLLAHL